MSQIARISDKEMEKLREISKKTGVPLKKLIDVGAKHVINEWKKGNFGILTESNNILEV